MNAHIFTGTEITTGRRKPSEIVAEYEVKREALAGAFATFISAGDTLKNAATIGGTWGNVSVCTGRTYESQLADCLLKSAWRHVFQLYKLDQIASAADKHRFEMLFEKPPAFTVANIREAFGDLVMDPWGAVLRGLAEVFAGLDPAFKSHERMKIGVKGQPKRAVIERITGRWGDMTGQLVLEPSCGDGRIMDALAARGACVFGVEVDAGRANAARAKGHPVLVGNFLKTMTASLVPVYDLVVMNPPFYGKHYAKHVRHALRFLKPDGKLIAILPSTARYDHGLLDDLNPSWEDLPVGSFAESGTNVCTSIATIYANKDRRHGRY